MLKKERILVGPEAFLNGMQSSVASKQRFMRARGGYTRAHHGGMAEGSQHNQRLGGEKQSTGQLTSAERKDKTLKALRFIRKFQHLYQNQDEWRAHQDACEQALVHGTRQTRGGNPRKPQVSPGINDKLQRSGQKRNGEAVKAPWAATTSKTAHGLQGSRQPTFDAGKFGPPRPGLSIRDAQHTNGTHHKNTAKAQI